MANTLTVFPTAARTTTANSVDQSTPGLKGALFTLDITAASGTTPTLDVKIQYHDTVSGTYVDIPSAAFAQKTDVGTDTLLLMPGVAATSNRQVNTALTADWRAVATIAGTTPSFTFTLAVTPIR